MSTLCPRCGSSRIEDGTCLRCGLAVVPDRPFEGGARAGLATSASLPEAPSQETARPAGFWIRLLASVLDGLVLSVVTALMGILGALLVSQSVNALRLAVLGVVFNIFFHAAYYIVLHGATGQTVGKLIVGVRVVSFEGAPISYGVAFLRWLGYWLSSITLMIGYILAGVRADKRALHDLVAGTRVIYVQ